MWGWKLGLEAGGWELEAGCWRTRRALKEDGDLQGLLQGLQQWQHLDTCEHWLLFGAVCGVLVDF